MSDVVTPVHGTDADAGTRRRVLELVATEGPVTAVQLARELDLTAAGVRRHLACLEDEGQIVEHRVHATVPARRGRPARRFVVATRGQESLTHRYAEVATDALRVLAEVGGPEAIERFAERRVRELEVRLAPVVAAAGPDVTRRALALVDALDGEGFAASLRPVPTASAVQVCQGHCPVQDVAAAFPQLCEAETKAFARLLGVHVQRLATLTTGGHVCTTNVPTSARPPIRNIPMEGVPA